MNLLGIFFVSLGAVQRTGYQPLATQFKVNVFDTEFTYGEQKRQVPLRIYLPEIDYPAPVILFSHGLGGSRENSKYLGNHWAGKGYVVVCMHHAGSDEEVMKDAPRLQKFAKLKAAAKPPADHCRRQVALVFSARSHRCECAKALALLL